MKTYEITTKQTVEAESMNEAVAGLEYHTIESVMELREKGE